MGKSLTQQQFLEKSRIVHGDKYDYSKVVYVGNRHKVIIGCPIHGDFLQLAGGHLKGCGCIKCAQQFTKRTPDPFTKEQFIEKASKVHSNKYTYDKLGYINSKKRVTITCPLHGDFKQFAGGHLAGRGCSKCFSSKLSNILTKTQEEFLTEAKKVHDEKYDYSLVDYTHSAKKVSIICPKHGTFKQTPGSHLSGRGCRKCSKTAIKPTEVFIEESKKLFPDRDYSYTRTDYKGNKLKLIITCNKEGHGDFLIKPNSHLTSKSGCPKCAKLGRRGYWTKEHFASRCKKGFGTFYIIKVYSESEEFIKIGITSRTVKQRYCDQKIKNYNYQIIKVFENDPGLCYDLEKFNISN